MKKRVNVTQKDISEGLREDCFACPIAQAVRRVIGPCRWFAVGNLDVWFGAIPVSLPVEAKKFINRFEGYQKVEPFSFEMEVPN